ncbi:hypothetical protein BRC97_05585 [Halobacteriales archaeon QS_6_71_20]|nr:MAG: hypothetical protein BRC97_05585 [Halobacteriales archaeon QS_6_71_20]
MPCPFHTDDEDPVRTGEEQPSDGTTDAADRRDRGFDCRECLNSALTIDGPAADVRLPRRRRRSRHGARRDRRRRARPVRREAGRRRSPGTGTAPIDPSETGPRR